MSFVLRGSIGNYQNNWTSRIVRKKQKIMHPSVGPRTPTIGMFLVG
jgi:hypothetical protein